MVDRGSAGVFVLLVLSSIRILALVSSSHAVGGSSVSDMRGLAGRCSLAMGDMALCFCPVVCGGLAYQHGQMPLSLCWVLSRCLTFNVLVQHVELHSSGWDTGVFLAPVFGLLGCCDWPWALGYGCIAAMGTKYFCGCGGLGCLATLDIGSTAGWQNPLEPNTHSYRNVRGV